MPKGVNHGQSKLDDREVIEIFRAEGSLRSIAAKYNVSFSTVNSIKKGLTWKHVTAEDGAQALLEAPQCHIGGTFDDDADSK